MRICPEYNSKLKISTIVKSSNNKEIYIKCSECNNELEIRTNNLRTINAIIVGAVTFFGILIVMWLNSVYGIASLNALYVILFALLVGGLVVIIERIMLIISVIIIGFKKRGTN